jgi:iron-sulfur cluster assembly enzyme ISCU, mitochondrial
VLLVTFLKYLTFFSISFASQNTDIAAHLKLPPVKLHCSMLAEDAIKAAVEDYKKKNTQK